MNEVYLGAGERDWTELCLEAMKRNEMKVYLGAGVRDMFGTNLKISHKLPNFTARCHSQYYCSFNS